MFLEAQNCWACFASTLNTPRILRFIFLSNFLLTGVTSSCSHCPCILSFSAPNWLLLICCGMNKQLTSLLAERVRHWGRLWKCFSGKRWSAFYYLDFVAGWFLWGLLLLFFFPLLYSRLLRWFSDWKTRLMKCDYIRFATKIFEIIYLKSCWDQMVTCLL